ncbi:protein FAM98B isoform X2 [Frankliniella occidentalis]|uniref:Protein FAM98B isoform X2 n=1 Tax=Frankliniella occidentalis TaxID=133901 RepID=A0A9C6WP19_FRAOC|nr:protein FAM98B isoform X2 [Frankliniella occidentalis]
MENDVIDALQDVGYNGPILGEGGLDKALEGTTKSEEFRKAVVWLAAELKALCKLDEQVNDISTSEDSASFLLELSSFLKEIGCQYKFLTEGHISERLNGKRNALLLLHYLVTELQSARMIAVKKPSISSFMEIKLQETSTASELKNMLIALKFPKPPDNIQPAQLFVKVEQRLKEVISKAPADLLSQPLFQGVLTDKQWHQLSNIQRDLHDEYRMRREMLIKRLDVTVQSFQWSDRVKHKGEEIANAMAVKRRAMSSEPTVELSDLLAARVDLAIIEKTSSANVRKNTQTQLTKVIIGRVPDRGGRTTDQAPPPPEMPSWQKERSAGGGGGRGGGGRGGGGGGGGGGGRGGRGGHGGHGGGGGDRNRVQGGWNQGSNDRGQGGYNRDRDQGRDQGRANRDQAGGWNRGGQDREQGGGWNRGGQDREQGGGWNRGGQGQDRDRGYGGGRGGGGGGGYRDQGHHGGRGGGRRDNNYR